MRITLTWLAVLAGLGAATPSQAQSPSGSCRPPLKFAAGACVAQCPAGYEDQGRACVYRSLSR